MFDWALNTSVIPFYHLQYTTHYLISKGILKDNCNYFFSLSGTFPISLISAVCCSNRVLLLSHIRHIKVSLRRQICICQKHFVILFTYCVTAKISLRQVLRSDSSPCRKSSLKYLFTLFLLDL